MHAEASVGSCALQTQKDREAGVGCAVRYPRCTRVIRNTPERGPLRVWVGTVCADLVFEVLSLYEPLEGFLRGCLIHRCRMGWKVKVKSDHVGLPSFLSALIQALYGTPQLISLRLFPLTCFRPSGLFSLAVSVGSNFTHSSPLPRCSPPSTILVDS